MAVTGRPTKYSEELVDKICTIIATSERGLHSIAKEIEVSPSTLFEWLIDPSKTYFSDNYARAKELQVEFMAQQIIDISDDDSRDDLLTDKGIVPNHEWINRSKLRVDARKWLMSKLIPKKWGDKIDVTSDGQKIASPVINMFPNEPKPETE